MWKSEKVEKFAILDIIVPISFSSLLFHFFTFSLFDFYSTLFNDDAQKAFVEEKPQRPRFCFIFVVFGAAQNSA